MKSPCESGGFLDFFRILWYNTRMQYKYIVFYPKGSRTLIVDIWETEKERTHPVYMKENGLKMCDVSSMGYFVYHPGRKKWALEHYQFCKQPDTVFELVGYYRQVWRDKGMIYRAWQHTPFFESQTAKEESAKDYQAYRQRQSDYYKDQIKKIWRGLWRAR